MAIDTLKVAKRLREAGFTEPQAEAVTAAVQEATQGAELATKADLAELRTELKAEIVDLRTELKGRDRRSARRAAPIRAATGGQNRSGQGRYSQPRLRPDPRYARRQHHRHRRSDIRGSKADRALKAAPDRGLVAEEQPAAPAVPPARRRARPTPNGACRTCCFSPERIRCNSIVRAVQIR